MQTPTVTCVPPHLFFHVSFHYHVLLLSDESMAIWQINVSHQKLSIYCFETAEIEHSLYQISMQVNNQRKKIYLNILYNDNIWGKLVPREICALLGRFLPPINMLIFPWVLFFICILIPCFLNVLKWRTLIVFMMFTSNFVLFEHRILNYAAKFVRVLTF